MLEGTAEQKTRDLGGLASALSSWPPDFFSSIPRILSAVKGLVKGFQRGCLQGVCGHLVTQPRNHLMKWWLFWEGWQRRLESEWIVTSNACVHCEFHYTIALLLQYLRGLLIMVFLNGAQDDYIFGDLWVFVCDVERKVIVVLNFEEYFAHFSTLGTLDCNLCVYWPNVNTSFICGFNIRKYNLLLNPDVLKIVKDGQTSSYLQKRLFYLRSNWNAMY